MTEQQQQSPEAKPIQLDYATPARKRSAFLWLGLKCTAVHLSALGVILFFGMGLGNLVNIPLACLIAPLIAIQPFVPSKFLDDDAPVVPVVVVLLSFNSLVYGFGFACLIRWRQRRKSF